MLESKKEADSVLSFIKEVKIGLLSAPTQTYKII
jgi:hypothetical protein